MWIGNTEWQSLIKKLEAIHSLLLSLETRVTRIEKKEDQIMVALTDVAAAVEAEDTVIASAVVLLNSIGAQIAAAGTDPVALAALQTDIQTNTAILAAAVLANTPAAPSSAAPVTPGAALSQATAAVAANPPSS